MAVVNDLCVSITDCTTLVITDDSTWDTVTPATDITDSDISIEVDGVVTTIEASGYSSTFSITATDLNLTTLVDGVYEITVTYTHTDATTYVIYKTVLQDCSVRCSLDKLILEIAQDTCDDCSRNSAIEVYELIASFYAMHAALECGNITDAELVLSCITNSLINYNCKNC